MNSNGSKPYVFFFLFFLCCCGLPGLSPAAVRSPVWAGSFYPADPATLRSLLEKLCDNAGDDFPPVTENGSLRALILPHAGYVYSGSTAAHAARVLRQGRFDKVILVGPDHNIGFRGGAVSDVSSYRTPLGIIPLHADAETLLRQDGIFHTSRESDQKEHSLEVILPFLQYLLGDFSLVPIVLGPVDENQVAAALRPLLDPRTLLVASSDLSHYLPYEQAVQQDRTTIDGLLRLDSTVLDRPNSACGRYGLKVLLSLARQLHWRPVLLHYANSGDTAGSKEKVVGYCAIAFFDNSGPATATGMLSQQQSELLLRIARAAIAGHLTKTVDNSLNNDLAQAMRDPVLRENGASFVTLTVNGRLRGCIGSLVPTRALAEDVRDNALNAAFRDPRFPPLAASELKDIQVEVSVLSRPVPLRFQDAADLVHKLHPHRDGVVLRMGRFRATYLPQVWEQLPAPEEFLSSLCRKAGLPEDAWKTGKPNISIYQVQSFHEKTTVH